MSESSGCRVWASTAPLDEGWEASRHPEVIPRPYMPNLTSPIIQPLSHAEQRKWECHSCSVQKRCPWRCSSLDMSDQSPTRTRTVLKMNCIPT